MPLSEAAEILRLHVIERRHRAVARTICLEGDRQEHVPRMSEAQWVGSCQLVRGVPEMTLRLLEEWVCGSLGSTWTVDAVTIRGRIYNLPKEQVAIKLKLPEAAEKLGWNLSYRECKALYQEAMSIVLDNLVERVGRVDQSYKT